MRFIDRANVGAIRRIVQTDAGNGLARDVDEKGGLAIGSPLQIARDLWEREIVRYLIGGGVNTVFTYALYLVILLFSVWEVANTVSYVVSIFSAYFINARYVFRQPLKWSKAVQFPLVYLVQYVVMMLLSALLINGLHIHEAIAPAIVTFVTIPITFLATRFLLKPRQSATPL